MSIPRELAHGCSAGPTPRPLPALGGGTGRTGCSWRPIRPFMLGRPSVLSLARGPPDGGAAFGQILHRQSATFMYLDAGGSLCCGGPSFLFAADIFHGGSGALVVLCVTASAWCCLTPFGRQRRSRRGAAHWIVCCFGLKHPAVRVSQARLVIPDPGWLFADGRPRKPGKCRRTSFALLLLFGSASRGGQRIYRPRPC